MDRYVELAHSEEDIHSLMRLDHILNNPAGQFERPRAGSEPPGGPHVAHSGHPPFSHGSMGMSLLNSGFDILPVANENAGLVQDAFGDGSGESLITQSPYYGPLSSSSSELSSLPEDVSEPSTYRQTTASSPQDDVPEDIS